MASNVFFELLFARAVPVNCWSHAIFLVGALLTFCLSACVHMVSSTTLAFTATHSALDSSTMAVYATRQVAVAAMVLMLCCMLCWMSSVGASATVKYAAHWGVSAFCAGYGLVALVLHLVQISAIERSHAPSVELGRQTLRSTLEEAVCSLLRAHTDAVATYRLWWRLAVGYLACVFGVELWAYAGIEVVVS